MKPLPKTGLSICLIVKNEAVILARCLESIKPAADEIVVVDTGSEDDTVKIAEQHGARTFTSDWRDDFSYSRNISVEHAQMPWILWLDADDIVPEESIPLINDLKQEMLDKVFGMIVRNQKPNGTGTEFIQARMFPNHPSIRFERPIHEQIMPSALRLGMKMVNTQAIIEHHGYADPADMKKKAERNVSLLLKSADETNPDPVLFVEVADSYTIMDDPHNAEVWYQKVINAPQCKKQFPVIASQAYLGLGNISNKSGNYKKAMDFYQKAQLLCPERTDALYSLAVSREMLGEKESAVDTLKQLISMNYKAVIVGVDYRQSKIKAYLRLLRLLRELGKKEELEKNCQNALEECNSRQEIQNFVGISYYYLDKMIDALHCFERSLKIIVQCNIDAYIGLCSIYLKVGKKEIAEQAIQNIKSVFKEVPKYWAFCEMRGFLEVAGPVPVEISRDEIEKEKENIVRDYNL